MTNNTISPDTRVTLLLCNRLGQGKENNSASPLSTAEYATLIQWLDSKKLNLSGLFEQDLIKEFAQFSRIDYVRLNNLISRGGALALAIEEWTNKGIWILSPHDETYPKRLIERLPNKVPPLLFGVGNQDLLSKGGLAVVGSREISERARTAAHQIGHHCVKNRIQLISGGARGVDSEGMQTVLEDGGNVLGFLADSLIKMSVNGKYRQGLKENRLVLVTANDPRTPFTVGNAMARNKFVYCLSDWTVVISSSFNEGGTWAGATENLKNKWVPLFVRKDVDVPEGNYRLIDKGAIPLLPESFSGPEVFRNFLKNIHWATDKQCVVCDLSAPYSTSNEIEQIPEPIPVPVHTEVPIKKSNEKARDKQKPGKGKSVPVPDSEIWQRVEEELKTPKTDKELTLQFKVELKLVKAWLSEEVKKGAIKKLAKPVRYVKVSEGASLDRWVKF
ncbi:MAG: DNA-processing protein DprA [Methanoregula sp.]|nr:DNA-processing protein DprA [Methanoregula sp.]